MYYRNRWYDPELGRFLSEDPIGFEGEDVNLYRFVGNNSVNRVDPDGLQIAAPNFSNFTKRIKAIKDKLTEFIPRFILDPLFPTTEKEFADQAFGFVCPLNIGAGPLAKQGLNISEHAAQRMAERGISYKMVETAIKKGKRFFDPLNKTVQHILEGGFASGKTLNVGQNPVTKRVTTVIRGITNKVMRPRYIPID